MHCVRGGGEKAREEKLFKLIKWHKLQWAAKNEAIFRRLFIVALCLFAICVCALRFQVGVAMTKEAVDVWCIRACFWMCQHKTIQSTPKADRQSTGKKGKKNKSGGGALLCFPLICQFLFAVGVNSVLLDFRFLVVGESVRSRYRRHRYCVYHSIYRDSLWVMMANLSFFLFSLIGLSERRTLFICRLTTVDARRASSDKMCRAYKMTNGPTRKWHLASQRHACAHTACRSAMRHP